MQTHTFLIAECCDVARLHWFNLLGGTDAYTFKTVSSTITALDSQQAQKPLNKVYDISDKGAVKIASDSVETYTAVSSYLQPDNAKWLIEVGQSVEVYLETTSGLLPIIVTNTEIQSQKRTSGDINLVAIEVTYKLANNTIIQYA